MKADPPSPARPVLRLGALIRERFQVSWGQARAWIETGKVWLEGQTLTDPGMTVPHDAPIELKMTAPRGGKGPATLRSSLAKDDVVFVDTQLVVVRKASGINTVPFEAGEKGSLKERVGEHLGQNVQVVHRIDRETSGLVVFARTREAEEALANQFRFHTVSRLYVALVHGRAESRTIRSRILENRGDGLRGSVRSENHPGIQSAKEAITHVEALLSFEGQTLVGCRLETGRTHQIRIHLSEAGHPLLGERAYNRGFPGAQIVAARLMLHAAVLGFTHPTRNVPMHWVDPPPPDFIAALSEDAKLELARRLAAESPASRSR